MELYSLSIELNKMGWNIAKATDIYTVKAQSINVADEKVRMCNLRLIFWANQTSSDGNDGAWIEDYIGELQYKLMWEFMEDPSCCWGSGKGWSSWVLEWPDGKLEIEIFKY